ncbi:MAG TPA: hypothetical protein VFT85_02880 [Acidimicrobiia bacterium]|nr:hypothetical protein [Acidimicrobiia bacterium]
MTDPDPIAVEPPSQEPPRYKRAVVIWIALYPAVVLALTVLRPLIGDWPIPLQALALTAVIIPAAVWFLIPLVQRLLGNWLAPNNPRDLA